MSDRGMLGNSLSAGSPPNPRHGSEIFPNRGMGTFKKRDTKPVWTGYQFNDDDYRRVNQQVRLYRESVGYKNLAGDSFVADQAKSAVQGALKDVFNVMEFLRNKWLILYRLYRGETLTQFEYGRTQLHSPEPFKIVETMHPRIMRALFGNERWFKMYGEHEHEDDNAKAQEMLCRDQFRRMGYQEKADRFVRDGLIYGTAIQKLFWKQEIGEASYRTAKRVPDDRFPGATKAELSEVKREELLYDGNHVENVSIFDCFASPNSSSVSEAEWLADRTAWPDWKVKQMGEMGHWMNLEALKDHPGTTDISYGDEFKERKSYAYGVFDPREASWAPHIPHYMVVDWWGPLVVKKEGGGYETKICNVVMIEPDGPEVIARVTVNPFWHQQLPYQAWKPISLEDEFYGIGPLEPIARLSMEKDMKRNLLMAAAQLEANPAWAVSDEANIADDQFLLWPGRVFRVGGDPSTAIVPIHVPQVSDSALKAENVLTKDIRETAGVTSPTMGAQDPFGGSKTATQHTSEVDESNARLMGPIQNFERQVITPMLHQMAWNNMQFLNYEKVIREIGPLGRGFLDKWTISPEDLVGRFIVQPLASHRLTTKQTQVQQLVSILDRAPVINQMYGPDAVKMPQLLAWILEFGFDIRNAEEFISLPAGNGSLLTASEEHELWYHGNVPPRRTDDNDMRHVQGHFLEFEEDRFAELERRNPGVAAKARAHAMDHLRKVNKMLETQEGQAMQAAQQGLIQQLMQGNSPGTGGSSAPAGAATPGQGPESPKVRQNEMQRGDMGGSPQSAAAQERPA